jgi:hypothetical protein
MMGRRWAAAGIVVGALALASCSSASSTSTTSSSPGATGTTGSSTTSSTGTGPAAAVNVPVTDAVRSELVSAGSALNNIPASEFSGLAPGLTYYGLDRSTGVHWAGARLVAAPSSDPSNPTQAQVSTQDEGSYYVFRQAPGAGWTAYASGNTGQDTPCPVTIPAAVLQVWGWPAGSCRPSGV